MGRITMLVTKWKAALIGALGAMLADQMIREGNKLLR